MTNEQEPSSAYELLPGAPLWRADRPTARRLVCHGKVYSLTQYQWGTSYVYPSISARACLEHQLHSWCESRASVLVVELPQPGARSKQAAIVVQGSRS